MGEFIVTIGASDLETIEFVGHLNPDGTISAINRQFKEWPNVLELNGIEFELDESESRETFEIAWYSKKT